MWLLVVGRRLLVFLWSTF